MKKNFFSICILLILSTSALVASQADLFQYDADAIENEMAQLDQLEAYLIDHPEATLGQLTAESNPLASLVSDANGVSGLSILNDKTLGIPGFVWGCCLSWVGILVVYLVGKDPVQTKQAIWGCVVGSVLGIGTSVALQMTGVLTQLLGGLSR